MTTKHTPGPWQTDAECDHQNVVGPDGIMVADCAIFGFGDVAENRSETICTANARLIAASPELLELVKQFEKTVEYEIRKDRDDEGRRMKTITLNIIRAALAKAEGRQP